MQKKHFAAKIWIPYFKATTTSQTQADGPEQASIKLGCRRIRENSSEHVYTDGTVQTTKVKAILVKPSKLVYNTINVSSLNFDALKTKNNCFLGTDAYMDLTKTRIITDLNVECKSHINSELLKPIIYLEKTVTSPTSSTDYQTTVDAYRSNPGGFVGFNFVTSDLSKVKQLQDFKGKTHLFPEQTYHHSEEPFEIHDLQFKLLPNHDLILLPNFDWFKAINASYILANGKQAMTVSKPFYEYNIIGSYLEL